MRFKPELKHIVSSIPLIIFLVLTVAPMVPANIIMSGDTVGGSELSPSVVPATPKDTPLHVNVILEKECLLKPITLIDCEVDSSGNVRNCTKSHIVFRKGCGILEVTHGQ
jgi:hypothetical protein